MKNLKLTIGALALMMTVNFSMAQSNASIEEKANAQTEKMDIQLELSSDQKIRVHDLTLGILSKNDAVLNDQNMPEATKNESIAGNNEAYNEMMKEILTPEQYTKFIELRSKKVRTAQKMDMKTIELNIQEPKKVEPAH